MDTPLVSVIVPSFKHEKYIFECLQSIADQTHPRLELIVIDDKSPDRTFEYARHLAGGAFAGRFENVILRQNAVNSGTHVSLNLGLDLAKGEFIAIINSDDRFHRRRIETLLAASLAEESEFAFSAVNTFIDAPTQTSAHAKTATVTFPDNLLLLNVRQRLAIARETSLGYALLRMNVAISTGNFFFSRRLAAKIGRFEPLRYCHDWDFILQALLHTQPVFVDEALYDYRLHAANTFRSVQHLAEVETEVVIRRFFRAVLTGAVPNPKCPSPGNDFGYFEAFVANAGYSRFWSRENGLPTPGQRVYDPKKDMRMPLLGGFRRLSEALAESAAKASRPETSSRP